MLWAVTMMKDEEDIANHVLYHLAQQGVDGIIVADNLSTDSTRQKLEEAKENIQAHPSYSHVKIEIVEDNVIAYTQGAKMTNLAHMAGGFGATWIIPFDADELWYAKEGTLAEAVARAEAAGQRSIKVPYWDYKITNVDPPGIPFVAMTYRKPDVVNTKTAFRYIPEINLSDGSHFIYYYGDPSNRDLFPVEESLYIRHYGVRSREHFIKKYNNAYQACKALPPNSDLYNGAAWNPFFATVEEGGLGQRYDEGWFETDGLIHDPAVFQVWGANEQRSLGSHN